MRRSRKDASDELDIIVAHLQHSAPGLADRGEGHGEDVVEVRAVVEIDPAHEVADDAIGEAIIAFCREKLAGYQVPRGVDVVASLPRTEAGKLARRTVREPYWEGRDRRI